MKCAILIFLLLLVLANHNVVYGQNFDLQVESLRRGCEARGGKYSYPYCEFDNTPGSEIDNQAPIFGPIIVENECQEPIKFAVAIVPPGLDVARGLCCWNLSGMKISKDPGQLIRGMFAGTLIPKIKLKKADDYIVHNNKYVIDVYAEITSDDINSEDNVILSGKKIYNIDGVDYAMTEVKKRFSNQGESVLVISCP